MKQRGEKGGLMRQGKRVKRKLVWVRFRDAAIDTTLYLDLGEKHDPLTIHEVSGLFVEENNDALIIAVGWIEEKQRWRGILGIPRECVIKKKIITLEV